MLFNADTFAVVPFAAVCSVGVKVRSAACTVFLFEKSDITFTVLVFLKLTVDTVFPVLKAASSCQNRVNIFLLNSKSRGFFVLCFGYHFDLFLYGGKIDLDLIGIGNAYL